MEGSRVQVVQETSYQFPRGGKLCFQWCRYLHPDGSMEEGYRFIWKTEDGKLLAHRGQARIPSVEVALMLIKKAQNEGWGSNVSQKDFE